MKEGYWRLEKRDNNAEQGVIDQLFAIRRLQLNAMLVLCQPFWISSIDGWVYHIEVALRCKALVRFLRESSKGPSIGPDDEGCAISRDAQR